MHARVWRGSCSASLVLAIALVLAVLALASLVLAPTPMVMPMAMGTNDPGPLGLGPNRLCPLGRARCKCVARSLRWLGYPSLPNIMYTGGQMLMHVSVSVWGSSKVFTSCVYTQVVRARTNPHTCVCMKHIHVCVRACLPTHICMVFAHCKSHSQCSICF